MLTVAEIMTGDPVTASPDTLLGDVIALMKTRDCRRLPILDGNRLVGIITDRDVRLAMNSPLTLHERAEDQTLLQTATAEAYMTPDPMVISAGAPAAQAAELMLTYKFSGLPVVEEGRLVGIVTTSDIMKSYISLLMARGESTS